VIKFGPLLDVTHLEVVLKKNSMVGKWELQHYNGNGSVQWSYPQGEIELPEGEDLELPILMRKGETGL